MAVFLYMQFVPSKVSLLIRLKKPVQFSGIDSSGARKPRHVGKPSLVAAFIFFLGQSSVRWWVSRCNEETTRCSFTCSRRISYDKDRGGGKVRTWQNAFSRNYSYSMMLQGILQFRLALLQCVVYNENNYRVTGKPMAHLRHLFKAWHNFNSGIWKYNLLSGNTFIRG